MTERRQKRRKNYLQTIQMSQSSHRNNRRSTPTAVVRTALAVFREAGELVSFGEYLGGDEMRVMEFLVGYCPRVRLWSCHMTVTIETASQFSAEWHEVTEDSRYWLLAIFRAWRSAKRLNAEIGAKRGERSAKGWA